MKIRLILEAKFEDESLEIHTRNLISSKNRVNLANALKFQKNVVALFVKNFTGKRYFFSCYFIPVIFNCYLALGHCWGDSLTNPILITTFFIDFQPKASCMTSCCLFYKQNARGESLRKKFQTNLCTYQKVRMNKRQNSRF